MERFCRNDVHRERGQVSSMDCSCHRKNESCVEAFFFLISQKEKIRKRMRYPLIDYWFQAILLLFAYLQKQ